MTVLRHAQIWCSLVGAHTSENHLLIKAAGKMCRIVSKWASHRPIDFA